MSEPNREPIPLREPILIKRYSVAARVHHWFTALTAILLALSGLAFFHPSLFFLTDLFGGPTWTRIIHPWLGVIMTLSFLDLFVRFWRQNIWHPEDWVWIKNLSLIGHHEERLPELRPLQRRPEGDVLDHDDYHLRDVLQRHRALASRSSAACSRPGRCGSPRSCTRPRP